MLHDFKVLSVKTESKDGKKYTGKDGSQAWRVSTKIGDDWHANMIFDEALVPKKGAEYNIELSTSGDFKNWEFKLLSKKEQVLGVEPEPFNLDNPFDIPVKAEVKTEDDFQTKVSRGASLNLSAQYVLFQVSGGTLPLKDWMELVMKHAKEIQPLQTKHVNE